MALTRRSFIKTSAAAALASSLGCTTSRRPPNIVLFLTDDQRADTLGCMGNSIIRTPHIDGIASKGVCFDRAFVTTSICMSSRASILTGQYLRRHGINDFADLLTPEMAKQTYAGVLRDAGYRMGFVGKYGIGAKPTDVPFHTCDCFGGQGVYFPKDSDKHLTALMAEQSRTFIKTTPRDKPFCLSVSFKAPHSQGLADFLPDPEFADLYSDVQFAKPPSYADYDNLPAVLKEPFEGRYRYNVRMGTEQKFQDMIRNYYRLITGVDSAVGYVVDTLKEHGISNDTVLIFTSDNGMFLGEHGFSGKWLMYEESIRVPLVILDPRAPASTVGSRRNEMVLNIDLAPTILELAGIRAPASMQGRSLLALTHGERPEWRNDWYYEYRYQPPKKPNKRPVELPRIEGVRDERWKYVRYIDTDPVIEQLFDLDSDPHEVKNLAASQDHSQRLATLRNRCSQLTQDLA